MNIDPARPVEISGHVTRDLSVMTTDPLHEVAMDLAQQTMQPGALRLADPVDEASVSAPAATLLEWLAVHPDWHVEFFDNLQCLAQTAAGEPLLTTWLSADRFWNMLTEGAGSPPIDAIACQVEPWRPLFLDEVHFDFHTQAAAGLAVEMTTSATAPAELERTTA